MTAQAIIESVGMAGTLVSMFMLGRPGKVQIWGLWLNAAAGLIWAYAGYQIASWPLVLQSLAIVSMNFFNLFSAHRRAG